MQLPRRRNAYRKASKNVPKDKDLASICEKIARGEKGGEMFNQELAIRVIYEP